MSLQCLSCGRPVDKKVKSCVCGFYNEGWYFMESKKTEIEKPGQDKADSQCGTAVKVATVQEVLLKEIDAWKISYSEPDQCISLSTPALQSFRLKLTLDELEGLVEFMYQKTGNGKTIRKLQLSAADVSAMIDRVHRAIEEKRARVPLKFNDDELQEITGYINVKLNE